MGSQTFVYGVALMVLLNGCATIGTLSGAHRDDPKIYSGTRACVYTLFSPFTLVYIKYVIPAVFLLIDLPFSFVADTVMLPLTVSSAILDQVKRHGHEYEARDRSWGRWPGKDRSDISICSMRGRT